MNPRIGAGLTENRPITFAPVLPEINVQDYESSATERHNPRANPKCCLSQRHTQAGKERSISVPQSPEPVQTLSQGFSDHSLGIITLEGQSLPQDNPAIEDDTKSEASIG